MPKFPPPPRRPQNKPAFVPALAVTISPSAVMTSQQRRLSQVNPYLRTSHPTPPPRVRPAMPVFETTPVGTAKPCGCVSRSTSPRSAPACTRTVRSSGSTETRFIAERSMTMPSSHRAPPGDIVTAAFDRDEKIVGARKPHGTNNIGPVQTAGDQARMLVNARVPNTSSRIIAGIAGQQALPTQPTSERLDGRLAHGGAIAAFERRRFHVSFLVYMG